MKMKVGTRILFTIFLIAVILLCLFVLASIVGLVNAAMVQGVVQTMLSGSFWYKFLYGAILVVVIVVCLILLFFGIKKETPKTAKIAMFESGSIVITVKAIEELVERYVRQNKDVKELHSKVVSNTDSIDISVEIGVLPDIIIPDVTTGLQTGLAEEISKTTGIVVRNTRITVMNIDDRLKAGKPTVN